MVVPNYPYNNNVPNPPDDPGDDVGDMNQNTKSIQNLIITDHIDFNTAGSGAHNRSQYKVINRAANLPPLNLIGSGYATMYSNTNGSIQEELFFTRGGSAVAIQLTTGGSGGPAISGDRGWTFLAGNLVMNFGKADFSAGTITATKATGTVSFLNPYGTSAYSIVLTPLGPNNAPVSTTTLGVTSSTTTTFSYVFTYSNAAAPLVANFPSFYWQAIGR